MVVAQQGGPILKKFFLRHKIPKLLKDIGNPYSPIFIKESENLPSRTADTYGLPGEFY